MNGEQRPVMTLFAAAFDLSRRAVQWVTPAARRSAVIAWLTLVPILTAIVVTRHGAELHQVGETLQGSDLRWIGAAIGIEIFTLLNAGLIYRCLLRRLGHELSGPALLAAHLRRSAIGAVSPLNGPVSVVMFVRIVKPWGVGVADSLVTLALRSTATSAAFLAVALGAVVTTGAAPARPIAALLVILATIVIAAFTCFRIRRPAFDSRSVQRLPNWARSYLLRFLVRVRQHRLTPRDLLTPFALAAINRLGVIGLLFVALHAVGSSASVGVVAFAYCAGLLAAIAVPVLQGAGTVETTVALALAHGGVPSDAAIGATLLWRLLEFWMPLACGLLLQIGAALRARVSGSPISTPTVPRLPPTPTPSRRAPRIA
jgi:uncharacterized membrane protein YbhN (UPF0104 family)